MDEEKREKERPCEKFNPLPRGYYSDNLLLLPGGPFMHSRGMPRRVPREMRELRRGASRI